MYQAQFRIKIARTLRYIWINIEIPYTHSVYELIWRNWSYSWEWTFDSGCHTRSPKARQRPSSIFRIHDARRTYEAILSAIFNSTFQDELVSVVFAKYGLLWWHQLHLHYHLSKSTFVGPCCWSCFIVCTIFSGPMFDATHIPIFLLYFNPA